MHIYYISSSIFPNRSANLIHTKKMCEAIISLGHANTLFLSRKIFFYNKRNILELNNSKNNIYSVYNPTVKLTELINALLAIIIYFIDLLKNNKPDLIISRNIFSSFFFTYFTEIKLIYETHIPEQGIRKLIQKKLFKKKNLKKVVISNKLREIICSKYNIKNLNNIIVLHDAADEVELQINESVDLERKYLSLDDKKLKERFSHLVGYFGHLYEGRGVELILDLAKMRHNLAFLIFGGSEKDILRIKNKNTSKNIFIMGHVDQKDSIKLMKQMDILLMPYQKKVSTGIKNSDTSKWMSPIKMFEYMSSNVPIISSDIPVLREVLVNNTNSLLVKSDDCNAWSNAILKIVNDKSTAKKISSNAYSDFKEKFTWKIRVEKIIKFLNE